MTQSTRIMNANIVLIACEQYIEEYNARLLAIQEPLVQREMKPKWFGLVPGKTREEAKTALGHDLWNKYNLSRLQFDYVSSNVARLRELCLAPGANDEITLSAEDAKILAKYFK